MESTRVNNLPQKNKKHLRGGHTNTLQFYAFKLSCAPLPYMTIINKCNEVQIKKKSRCNRCPQEVSNSFTETKKRERVRQTADEEISLNISTLQFHVKRSSSKEEKEVLHMKMKLNTSKSKKVKSKKNSKRKEKADVQICIQCPSEKKMSSC